MLVIVYRLLINLIILLSPIIIIFRLIQRKEDLFRFKEKFCFFSEKKRNGNLIWFHGASVGEIKSIVPLIEKLEKEKKISQILVTSSTLSSSKIFKKFKFKKTIHQFFPIDGSLYTKKFLNYWKPSLAVFIDSEIWPNMLLNINKKKIPTILLNARITKKSFNRWLYFKSFAQKIFQCFDITFPQNKETTKYLKILKVKKIKHLGNIKFSEIEYHSKSNINLKIKKFLKNKNYWCAASTHNNEEIISGNVHLRLKKKIKNLITFIIPRHIQRTEDIVNSLQNLNLKVHCHSSKENIRKSTDIYIVDTYGETNSFFKINGTVFLGGSLIKHGGQNPIEPARNGCKIIYGPHVENFKEVYELLDKNKVSYKVNNMEQLASKVGILIKKNKGSKNLEDKINKLGKKILKKTLFEFKFYLNKI
jgi:3-deoxy-D-manno-octulosonic-acid transferase